jgi:hypothetical protein
MAIPARFEALLRDPAPGLRFPPHARVPGSTERVRYAPHMMQPPASAAELATLRARCGASPRVLGELLEFYKRWNGVDLCCLKHILSDVRVGALCIPSITEMEAENSEVADSSWLFDGLEDVFVPGNYVVIAHNNSEGTRLLLMLRGQHEGWALEGRVLYLAADPVLSFTEPLAESFFGLIGRFAADPSGFLHHIGYCNAIEDAEGRMYGDVATGYIPDVRGLPNLIDWP